MLRDLWKTITSSVWIILCVKRAYEVIMGTFLHVILLACKTIQVITICVKTILFRYYVLVPKQNAWLIPFEKTEESGYVEYWYIVHSDYLLITTVINFYIFSNNVLRRPTDVNLKILRRFVWDYHGEPLCSYENGTTTCTTSSTDTLVYYCTGISSIWCGDP